MRLGTTCSLPPRPWSRAAATSRTHVGSPVADVDVGYRPADALFAEARRRDFKNPTYRPDDRVIYPLVGRQHLVLFDAWFQRWHGAVNGVYWDAD